MLLPLLLGIWLLRKGHCEPVPLDLLEQHGANNHHGHGDVPELWEENQSNPKMRNALRRNATNRWTRQEDWRHVIPFEISGNFTESEMEIIAEAMEQIGRNTCIRFRRRTGADKDFVDIQNEYGEGCYTNVGRLAGRNVLMLESTAEETCVTHSTVLHELLHKIGLWHEQMRADRDDYLRVHFENIPFYLHSQFRKVGADRAVAHQVGYNYRSLMHYGQHAFAAPDDAVAMETKQRRFQDVIGTAKDASPGDYIKVCAIYECRQCIGRPFDAHEEAKVFSAKLVEEQRDSREQAQGTGGPMEWEEPECVPVAGCSNGEITRSGNPTVWKVACCEPCSECRPNAAVCGTVYAQQFAYLMDYECCGRCKKRNPKQ